MTMEIDVSGLSFIESYIARDVAGLAAGLEFWGWLTGQSGHATEVVESLESGAVVEAQGDDG